jgi:hypothetical protein
LFAGSQLWGSTLLYFQQIQFSQAGRINFALSYIYVRTHYASTAKNTRFDGRDYSGTCYPASVSFEYVTNSYPEQLRTLVDEPAWQKQKQHNSAFEMFIHFKGTS